MKVPIFSDDLRELFFIDFVSNGMGDIAYETSKLLRNAKIYKETR